MEEEKLHHDVICELDNYKVDAEEDERKKKREKGWDMTCKKSLSLLSIIEHKTELNKDNNHLAYNKDLEHCHHERNRMTWYIRVELKHFKFLKNEIDEANDLETIERLSNEIEVTKVKHSNFYNMMCE